MSPIGYNSLQIAGLSANHFQIEILAGKTSMRMHISPSSHQPMSRKSALFIKYFFDEIGYLIGASYIEKNQARKAIY
jgi:hypothetical protein